METLGSILEVCKHPNTELRKLRIADGRIQLRQQCLECGIVMGQAISQAGIDLDGVPFVDLGLQEHFVESRRERWTKARQEEQNRREQQYKDRHREYEEYISISDEWQYARTRVLERDGHICQACLCEKATQVHHKNYDHLYDEVLFDLVSVCDACHRKIHDAKESS